MNWVEEYGYAGLFLFCFLAATIIPISSESAVIGALFTDLDTPMILFWATIGNCLGTLVNYFLGYWIGEKWLDKKMNKSTQRSYNLSKNYGWPALLLSWLPIIGDPITIIGGVLRWNIIVFISIVFSLRFLRYYLIIQLIL